MNAAVRMKALEDENAELQEKLRQFHKEFAEGENGFPPALCLSKSEARLFAALMAGPMVTNPGMMIAVYNWENEVDPKIIAVMVCKMRKKIAPFGIKITTVWGRGYAIDPESKRVVRRMLA